MGEFAYRIDIDNTIASPRFFHPDLQICKQQYVNSGIVREQDVSEIQSHRQLFLLPQVALTHVPRSNAVASLRQLFQRGHSVAYCTTRNSVHLEKRRQIHESTYCWLKTYHFPNPMRVHFVWEFADKLTSGLDIAETPFVVIDDLPGELLKAYKALRECDPRKAAQVRERVVLVAFRCQNLDHLPRVAEAPRVLPLNDWNHFSELLPQLCEGCS